MLFGQWIACSDAKAHYFLGAKPLCGARSSPTDEPVREPATAVATAPDGKIVVVHCAACLRANENRWAGVPAKPPGVA